MKVWRVDLLLKMVIVTSEEEPNLENVVEKIKRMDGVEDVVGVKLEVEKKLSINLDDERERAGVIG